jgi:hypothetical protein
MQAGIEIGAYKARLDSAIKAERWDEVDRIRLALKRRLLEAVAADRTDEIAAISQALGQGLERLTFGKRIRLRQSAETAGAKLAADSETAGLGTEVRPVLEAPAANVEEAILQLLRTGNGQPLSSGEISERTGHRPETIARTLTSLRASGQVATYKAGRHRLHVAVTAPKVDFKTALGNMIFIHNNQAPAAAERHKYVAPVSLESFVDSPKAQVPVSKFRVHGAGIKRRIATPGGKVIGRFVVQAGSPPALENSAVTSSIPILNGPGDSALAQEELANGKI